MWCAYMCCIQINGVPLLFYNMIYKHHSHININDLLNKFPIICYIRKCVEPASARCIFTFFLRKHSFISYLSLVVTWRYRDDVDDDEEKVKETKKRSKERRRTYATMKINNRILLDALCTSKCINTIIYCCVRACQSSLSGGDGKNVRVHFPIFTIYLFRAFIFELDHRPPPHRWSQSFWSLTVFFFLLYAVFVVGAFVRNERADISLTVQLLSWVHCLWLSSAEDWNCRWCCIVDALIRWFWGIPLWWALTQTNECGWGKYVNHAYFSFCIFWFIRRR